MKQLLFAILLGTIPTLVGAAELRLGLIGLDTSHVTAFTELLNNPKGKDHVPGARVVAAFKGGSAKCPAATASGGQSSLYVDVGLGNATNADLVRIEWPSGTVQELRDVEPKQFLTVTEPARLQALGTGAFRVQSWKGMAFEVQVSTEMEQWSPLTTVTNLTGTLEFTDLNSANHLRRFYRTVLR